VSGDCETLHFEYKETEMPSNENVSQPENQLAAKQEMTASSLRKSMRKAPGTRLGTLQDWRTADNSGKTFGRHGHTIRDGR
jgi:hypothetical protein